MSSARVGRSVVGVGVLVRADAVAAVAVTGSVAAHRLLLDGRDLGPAEARPLVMAAPGVHRLRLVDVAGQVVDQIRFTIR